MGLFSILVKGLSGINQHIKKKEEQHEQDEINNAGLEDWQKEEVRLGNYDTFNFEESDATDEDD